MIMNVPTQLMVIVSLGLLLGWQGAAHFQSRTSDGQALPAEEGPASLLGKRERGRSEVSPSWHDESQSSAEQTLAFAYSVSHPGEFPHRLKEILALPNTLLRRDALAQLLGEWVMHNDAQAFEACRQVEDSASRALALQWLVIAWASHDSDAALEKVNALPDDHEQKKTLLREIALQLGKTDPLQALELIARAKLPASRSYEALFEAAARQDLEAAIAQAGASGESAWKGVLKVWLETAPSAAVEHYVTQSGEPEWRVRNTLQQMMPQILEHQAPLDALDLLSSKLKRDVWEEVRGSFADAWYAKDPEAAVTWVASQEDDALRDTMARSIAHAMANRDPSGAFDYLLGHGLPEQVGQVASEWARQDWNAAYRHLESLDDDPTTQARAAAGLLSAASLEMTFEQIQELLAFTEDQRQQARVSNLLTRLEVEEVEALLDRFPVSVTPAMESYLGDLAERDPKSAADLASRLPDDSPNRGLYRTIVKWTANDPDAAATWLATLPDGPSRETAYRNYANALSRSHPQAMEQWLANVPDDVRERAVEEYVSVHASQSPGKALAYVLEHTPENQRLLRQAMSNLHHVQPDAARERLAEISGIDDGFRDTMEELFERNDQWRRLGNVSPRTPTDTGD